MQYYISHKYIFVCVLDDWMGWFRTLSASGGRFDRRMGCPAGFSLLAYWGFFRVGLAMRKEKALIGYGFSGGRKCRGYAAGLELPTGASLFRRGRDTLRNLQNSKMCPFCFLPLPFVRKCLRGSEVSFLLPVFVQVFVTAVKNGLVDHFGRG